MLEVVLAAITPNAEELIARCARVSHRSVGSGPDDDARLIRKLVAKRHWSVLEHAQATFLITGISRVCLAQLTRHRHLSFTVESQRVCDMRKDAKVVIPGTISPNGVPFSLASGSELAGVSPSSARLVVEARKAIDACLATCAALFDAGVPKEDARYFLPQGIETRLAMSGNFRALLEFIEKRTVPEAQWEVRALAQRILEIMSVEAPNVFGAVECDDHYTEEGRT